MELKQELLYICMRSFIHATCQLEIYNEIEDFQFIYLI